MPVFFRLRRIPIAVLLATVAVLVALVAWACGSSGTSNPVQPAPVTPTPTPPSNANTTYTLAGVVSDAATHRPVQGGTVTVTTGPNANKVSATDGNGYYSIPGLLPGSFTVHAAGSGYNGSDQTVTLLADTRFDMTLQAASPILPAGQCDPSLWNHMHDPSRLQMVQPCITVTGVVAQLHQSDDGDVEPPIVPDAQYRSLLNDGNNSKLNGWLQVEAICQAPVHPDVPDAMRACANFTGHVLIPPVGAHVRVTGSYTIDHDHGWMEIHPVTSIAVIP